MPAQGGAASVARWLPLVADTNASSLVEFAVSLPFLVVLVVGIFDFGGAFNTKQELNNAAREAARYGASEPIYDLSNPIPVGSIDAVRTLVDSYLQASRINDCGLNTVAQAGASPTWTYTTIAQNGCVGTFTLTIVRGFGTNNSGCTLPATGYGSPNPINPYIPCTHVTISYPYQWMFNSVISLIVPNANYGPLIQIQTDATAINMD
jgi:Flp pilus assembly protein TadG